MEQVRQTKTNAIQTNPIRLSGNQKPEAPKPEQKRPKETFNTFRDYSEARNCLVTGIVHFFRIACLQIEMQNTRCSRTWQDGAKTGNPKCLNTIPKRRGLQCRVFSAETFVRAIRDSYPVHFGIMTPSSRFEISSASGRSADLFERHAVTNPLHASCTCLVACLAAS